VSTSVYIAVEKRYRKSLHCFTDIDQCKKDNNACPAFSRCVKTRRGYECRCRHGFELHGARCAGQFLTVTQSLNSQSFLRDCVTFSVFTARSNAERYYAERGYATVRRLSVCPSVRNVQVCFSRRLEYFFENNFTAD